MHLSGSAVARDGESNEVLSFGSIFRDHAPYIWRLLRRLGATTTDADDLCQEVFLVLHRRLPELDLALAIRPWLYGVAVRVASEHRKKRRVTVDTYETLETSAPAMQHDDLQRSQARSLLHEAIMRLDDSKRDIFVLHELEELTMNEIATALSCPVQTAYSRLHAARKEIKAFFARLEQRETVA